MIIFIHGQDTYSSNEYLNKLIEQFRAKHGQAISIIHASETSWESFLNAERGSDLFNSKKMIVVKEILLAPWQDDLSAWLENKQTNGDTILVVYLEGKADSRLKLVKILSQSDNVKEFAPLGEARVSSFLMNGLRGRGKTIDAPALGLLLAEVGSNLWRAENELEKLGNTSAGNITVKEVVALVASPAQDYIWKFLDAYSAGNKKEALRLLEKEFLAGLEPMPLLYLFIRQIRMLLAWQGKKLNQAQLAKLFNLPSFAASKLTYSSRKFSTRTLVKILQALGRLDSALKSSRADHRLLFFLLVDSITK